jgi:hypothetical protein
MASNGIRPGVWLVAVGSVAAIALLLYAMSGSRKPAPIAAAPAPEPAASAPELSPRPRTGELRTPARPASIPQAPEDVPYIEGLVYGDIDLREAKELMPDNLYWKWGSPTKDEKLLEERAQERRRRNEEYGRVLAGDANEDEVRAYYDYRRKLSSDYLEFAEFMARRHRNSENEQFRGMLDLAVNMNADRLKQLAADEEAALAKSRDQARLREEWRRQQEEFRAAGAGPVGDEGEDLDQ